MKKEIIFEKIIIYAISLLFCFSYAVIQKKENIRITSDYENKIESHMKQYDFTRYNKDIFVYDIELQNNDDRIKMNYKLQSNVGIKVDHISASINLNYVDDIDRVIDIMNFLYEKDDIILDKQIIMNLINKYKFTGKETEFEDINDHRQLIISVKPSEFSKDFLLDYYIVDYTQ